MGVRRKCADRGMACGDFDSGAGVVQNPEDFLSVVFARVYFLSGDSAGRACGGDDASPDRRRLGIFYPRILEAGTRTMWLMAVLYVPMLLGHARIL